MAKVIDITPVLDTSAYADGDVLFVPIEIAPAASGGGTVLLQSVGVIDEDDQGVAFDLVFFRSSVTLGTINAACSITDADARNYAGRVQVTTADYYDLGGNRIADVNNIGRLMRAADNKTSIWVGGISRGAGTYTASGLRLRLGFVD